MTPDALRPPVDRNGYAIDRVARTFHRRYADHAKGLPRVRTVTELRGYARPGEMLVPCAVCWPPEVTRSAEAPDVYSVEFSEPDLPGFGRHERWVPAMALTEPGLDIPVSTAHEKRRGAARQGVADERADPSPLPSTPDPDRSTDESSADEA